MKKITIKIKPTNLYVRLKKIISLNAISKIIETYRDRDRRGLQANYDAHSGFLILRIINPSFTYEQLVNLIHENAYVRNFLNMNEGDNPLDRTVYIKFINSLTPEILAEINSYVLRICMDHGFIINQKSSIDSTIKDANVTYPTDAKNLLKLLEYLIEVINYFNKKVPGTYDKITEEISISDLFKKFKAFFFEKSADKRNTLLSECLADIRIIFERFCNFQQGCLKNIIITKAFILKKYEKICRIAETYFYQVEHYIKTQHACPDKILSFHQDLVACITKKKEDKNKHFGARWQIIKLANNFCLGFMKEDDLFFSDSTSMSSILDFVFKHVGFIPTTVLTDRGYDSLENTQACIDAGVNTIGIQSKKIPSTPATEVKKKQKNERAGIEPIIGHLKKRGLGKSRMLTDIGTMIEGCISFISLNISKLLSLTA